MLDRAEIRGKLERVQQRARKLHAVFHELSANNSPGSQTFQQEVHCNALPATHIDPMISELERSPSLRFLDDAAEALIKLSAKPTQGVAYELNHSKWPFGWLCNILNALRMLEEFDRPVASASPVAQEELNRLLAEYTRSEIAALAQVGDTRNVAVDTQRLQHYAQNVGEAFSPGVDAQEYLTILSTTLQKGDALPDGVESAGNKGVRTALIRVLNAVSRHIARTTSPEIHTPAP